MLVIALAVLATSGCSTAGMKQDPEQPFNGETWTEYVRAYEKRKSELTFPPGYPGNRVRHDPSPPPDEPATYEMGAGAADAVFEWACAWQADAIKRHRAKKNLGPALTMVAKLRSTPEYADSWSPQFQADYIKALEKARLGDVSGLMQHVSMNCVDLIS